MMAAPLTIRRISQTTSGLRVIHAAVTTANWTTIPVTNASLAAVAVLFSMTMQNRAPFSAAGTQTPKTMAVTMRRGSTSATARTSKVVRGATTSSLKPWAAESIR